MPHQNEVAIVLTLDQTTRAQAVALGTTKAVDLYHSCMDREKIEKVGAAPLKAL